MFKLKEKRILCLLLILTSILSLFNIKSVKAETNLDLVIEDIKLLEEQASNYIKENNISKTVNELTLGYISNDGYNEIWETSGNSKDVDFEEYVSNNSQKSLSYLQRALKVNDIDFHLLINSVNVLSKQASNYCNWGYLLVSAAIANGNSNKSIEEIMHSLYFTDDISKMNAVMDAVNISKTMYLGNLSTILDSYYNDLNEETRIRNFTSLIFPTTKITKDNLRTNVYSKFISDDTIVTALGNKGIALSNNENLLKAVCYKFSDYIYENHPDSIDEPKEIFLDEIKTNEIPKSLNIGEEFEIVVTLIPENVTNKEYTIISTDENVIEVDGNKIIAKTSGKASIVIKSGNKEIKKDLIVYGTPSIIKSNKTEYTLNVGEEVNLFYEFDVLSNEEVIWETTSSYVSVDKKGNVKALNAGTAIVYCKLKNNPTVYLKYDIRVESPVDSLIIKNKSNNEKYNDIILLNNKDVYFLEIDIEPTNEKNNLTYKSSNENICIVKNGVITTKGVGTCIITVMSSVDSNKNDTVEVRVLPPVEKATFSETEIYVNLTTDKNKEFENNVKFYPEDVDTNLLDFYIYKIDKNGNEKRDFSGISYDYEKGILVANKIGNYKVVCINRENYKEVGFFTVTVEFADVELENPTLDKDDDTVYKNPFIDSNNFLAQLKGFIILLLVVILVGGAVSVVLLIIDIRKDKLENIKGNDEDFESVIILEDPETVSKNVQNKKNINNNKVVKENKDEDKELDKLIKDISDSFEGQDLIIDGISMDTYIEEYKVDLGEDIIKEIKEVKNLKETKNDKIDNED